MIKIFLISFIIICSQALGASPEKASPASLLEGDFQTGVELIMTEPDAENLSSAGGHAILRIISDHYLNDVGLELYPSITQEQITLSKVPGLVFGAYKNIVNLDLFWEIWDSAVRDERKTFIHTFIPLSRDQISELVEVVRDVTSQAEHGNYMLINNNCVSFLTDILISSGIMSASTSNPVTAANLRKEIYEQGLSFFPSWESAPSFTLEKELEEKFELEKISKLEVEDWKKVNYENLKKYIEISKSKVSLVSYLLEEVRTFPILYRMRLRSDFREVVELIQNSKNTSMLGIFREISLSEFDSILRYWNNLVDRKKLEFGMYLINYKDEWMNHLSGDQYQTMISNFKVEHQSFYQYGLKDFRIEKNQKSTSVYLYTCISYCELPRDGKRHRVKLNLQPSEILKFSRQKWLNKKYVISDSQILFADMKEGSNQVSLVSLKLKTSQ